MKLRKLEVRVNAVPVREITFKDGLNLVTNKRGVGRSGNSIGKSTLSRVVDYLLLAPIEAIYIDEEFNRPNEEIEFFLTNNTVEATLAFIGYDGRLHSISRNLSISSKDRTYSVDGVAYDEPLYQAKLLELCFYTQAKRPSVRALAPKFIRNNSHRMLNTTKFLDRWAGNKDYSELFLYLFGFGNSVLLTEKREATNAYNRRKKQSAIINALVKEQKPAAEIRKYQVEIQKLEHDFLNFDYSPEYDDPVKRLGELQCDEDSISSRLLAIERKIKNIKTTIEMLSGEGGNHLVNELRAIYEYAGVATDRIVRDFEDVLAFHDNLVAKKQQFLTIDLPGLEAEHVELLGKLNKLHDDKSNVFADMRSAESIRNITDKLKELGELKVSLGKTQGLLDQQLRGTKELTEAECALSDVLSKISKETEVVVAFEAELNIHFSRITDRVHADTYKFSLNFDSDTGDCNINIENNASNPEGGKKKAEVIAFDLAYIEAVSNQKILRPQFVFHDGIEDIDQKQIAEIFTISRGLNGQQIVSMLSDKLTPEMYDEYLSDCILLLADDDMFFKV